jgi:hypothetical protein
LRLKYKIVVAFTLLMLLLGSFFVVQWLYLRQEPSLTGSSRMDETFTAQDFTYGPQAWVPYASKLAVAPGVDVNGAEEYYLMFVDLNATSNMNATYPCVRVDYAFSGLNGHAAFHLYGYIHSNGGISWTNRVGSLGESGWYVQGNASASGNAVSSEVQPLQDINHVAVKVANQNGASYNDFGNDTYYLKFEKEGGGLNSLHITANPKNPTGEVTATGNQTGTFFVDFTGDRAQDDFILLVAVSGAIGSDFQVNLKSSVP